jgi:biopolymer transport protein ExbD
MSASTLNPESAEPMMDINTTPLIDVMLVLLIMFIITIPVQTHAVKLDLPQPQPNQPPPPIDPVKNTINIMPNNAVLWNGTPVDLVRLRQYLDYTTTLRPTPELHLAPDPEARYEQVDEVLAVTKRANITAMGFIGNERYTQF